MPPTPTPLTFLEALGEPTRLRIVNCLAAAPLFVSDLQVILGVPQPTVSRHLKVLRDHGLVRDTPIAQFVLYRLRRPAEPLSRAMSAILDAALVDPVFQAERGAAAERSRIHARGRLDSSPESAPA